MESPGTKIRMGPQKRQTHIKDKNKRVKLKTKQESQSSLKLGENTGALEG